MNTKNTALLIPSGKSRSRRKNVVFAILAHKMALVGVVIIVSLICMAVFAPFLAPHDPNDQDLYRVLEGPTWEHLLGTDDVGRDLLSRVIFGARISLIIGIVSTFLSALMGSLLGLIAGYKGGVADMVIMRITDTFMCLPVMVMLLVIVAVLGPGVENIIIAISVLTWTTFARIMRGQVLYVRELPYIEAAHADGASELRIMFKNILPNAISPIIVAISIMLGRHIMLESIATFLGLGVQPPTPTWGKALRVGYSYLEIVPLYSIAPGLMITLAVLGFNFLGDGLRDALDPRLRGEGRKI
ncbi:MAG: ABC transporter permease [Desulfobacteraceae bacterium]|nr:ABC transporter permease [Desulfobacteraceae bacterium]